MSKGEQSFDKIAEALGLEPEQHQAPTQQVEKITPIELKTNSSGELVPVADVKDQGTGFEDVQEAIKEAAQLGAAKLQELGDVASQSQHPRAYEAFTQLLKEVVGAQKELLEINKTQAEIKKAEQNAGVAPSNDQPQSVTNQLIFQGSTAEFQKMISQMKGDDKSE